jgi:hypothetical protein
MQIYLLIKGYDFGTPDRDSAFTLEPSKTVPLRDTPITAVAPPPRFPEWIQFQI